MIALWLGLALAGSTTAGMSFGATGVRTAARHVAMPTLGAWALHRDGFVWGGELSTAGRTAESALYSHRRREWNGALLLGGGIDKGFLGVDWLAGPGLGLAFGSLKSPDIDQRFVEPTLGLKLRNSIDLRPSEHAVVRIGMGALVRDVDRWDFDVFMGLGGSF